MHVIDGNILKSQCDDILKAVVNRKYPRIPVFLYFR